MILRGLLAALLVLALLPAGTSVAEEHEGTEEETTEGETTQEEPVEVEEAEEEFDADIVQLDHTIPIPPDAHHYENDGDVDRDGGKVLWTLPETRQGFVLADQIDDDNGGTIEGFRSLIELDLDTGDEIGRVQLDPPAWSGGEGAGVWTGSGQPNTAVVDREGGRIFVAYGIRAHTGQSPVQTTYWTRHTDRAVADQDFCVSVGALVLNYNNYTANCLRGIHVIDAETLQVVDSIPIDSGRIDGYPTDVITGLSAMSYSPPRTFGDSGKLHLLVEDFAYQVHHFNIFQGSHRTRTQGTRSVYALQVDADTGSLDWGVPLRECRYPREQAEDLQGRGETADQQGAHQIMRGPDPEDPSVWVACYGRNRQGLAVRIPLGPDGFPELLPVRSDAPDRVVGGLQEGHEPGSDDVLSPRTSSFPGPPLVSQFLAEPHSGRILMKAMTAGEVWWVFDIRRQEYVGTIGISSHYKEQSTMAGVDPSTGRLYVLGPNVSHADGLAGGLYTAEAGHTPVPQALRYPGFVELFDDYRWATRHVLYPLSVEPGDASRPTRIYVYMQDHFVVLEDRREPGEAPPVEVGGHSLDIPEQEGVTTRSIDGAAQGFGARAILVGGLEGAGRVGPVDPGFPYNVLVVADEINPHDCSQRDRDVTLGFVGAGRPVTVSNGGSSATAVPLMVDGGTRTDPSQPYARCGPNNFPEDGALAGQGVDVKDWESLWETTGLLGKPPVAEPGAEWPFEDGSTGCNAADEESAETDRSEGGPNGEWESEVDCEGEGAEGYSRTRGGGGDAVVVADVWSTFDIYLDPERGLVSRMASMARGVTLMGPDGQAAVRIDTVKAVAESWANGRVQPAEVLADEQDPDYDPNCDLRRTAGTCFERHLLGVQIVDDEGEERYSCGPCGDEEAFVEGMNAALGENVAVQFRHPDPAYARGARNGSQAAIQKPTDVAKVDSTLKNDLLENVVPALEIVRYAPYTRTDVGGPPGPPPMRGHQLYQLAGVHAGSTYGIQCLLVVHPDGSCAPAAAKPGTVTVTLEDTDGEPLEGGLFEVYADPTGDGLLGLDDPLTGTCVTDTDGSCSIEELQPGSYVVHQSAAPAGYAPGGEVPINIASGESWTVQFVNIAQVANIEIALTDADDQRPLEGGVFEAWVDDGDGVIGATDLRTASCTTDADGSCVMAGVPLGGFVVAQSAAPRMYTPAEPIAFALAQPGQTARVSVANAKAASAVQAPADDGSAGGSDDFAPAPPAGGTSDPGFTSQPQQQEVVIPNITVPAPNVTVTVNAPTSPPAPVVAPSAPAPSVPQQIVALPRDAWDFAARDPVQAAAYGGIWLLMASAVGAVWRRRSVAQLLATT